MRRRGRAETLRERTFTTRRYDPPAKFTYLNGNGARDPAEPCFAPNPDGLYDPGEPFTDTNRNGRWDPGASLKVTVARYYLPDGRNLNGKYEVKGPKVIRTGGIVPDVETKADELDLWERHGQQDVYKSGAVR